MKSSPLLAQIERSKRGSECSHQNVAMQRMPAEHVYYAQQICADCGRHLGWLPKQQENIDRLCATYLKGGALNQLFVEGEVRKALAQIIERGGVFEVRALEAKLRGSYRRGTIAGYFNSVDQCVTELDRLDCAKGVYVTLNPVNPALLARCANRLDYAEKSNTTADHHIQRRRWLLLDVDAERPSGIGAADAEKDVAKKKAREIYNYLKARGWPLPLVADSGNGFHLLYRANLPCADDGVLEKVLTAMAGRFDGDGVKLDRSVHNPARIARLYGTLAAKGDNTKERPHRLSKIIKAPKVLEVVSAEQLRGLADELQQEDDPARVAVPAACNGAFDVEGFLTRHDVEFCERTTGPDGTIKWQLTHCPFNHDHVDGEAAVFQYRNGKLGFHCFHSSCADKHWKDFRRHFEPERKTLPRPVEVEASPVELPPPVPYVPPPLTLLPPVLQEYVYAAAESLNVDVSFILLPMLSSLGTAIGNSRSILLKSGFIQPPVIWTAIIARSGGRKSPSIEYGCFAVNGHDRELTRQNSEAEEIYANELAEWEKKGKGRGAKPEKPKFLTCICDDLTIEALADILSQNPRGGVLVRKDELSHWLTSFDQYKNAKGSDVSRWLSLHTAASLAVDRRTDARHYRITNPRVCLSGGIQPDILRRELTPEFFERGLPARIIFSYPPFRQDKWNEATVPQKLRDRVFDLFDELWLLQPQNGNPVLLTLDRDAKGVFVDFYNHCGESAYEASEHEEAAWGKLSGGGARFALVGQLAHNPGAQSATGAIMESACQFALWCGKESARIYDTLAETQEQRDQRKLMGFIESRGGAVTIRDVMQGHWPLKNHREKAEAALSGLAASGYGQWQEIKPPQGGWSVRKFRSYQHLHLHSPSTSVDVDAPKYQKNEGPRAPDVEAVSGEVNASPEILKI